jgi:hypothetical protein
LFMVTLTVTEAVEVLDAVSIALTMMKIAIA